MKCTIPEIAWHNRDPVYSVDIQPGIVSKSDDETVYRVATGGTDSHVLMWLIKVKSCGTVSVDFVADLQRHQRAVNVVRFSPDGQTLASGDDESVVMLWRLKTDNQADLWDDQNENNKEQWQMVKILRGHMEDVYDLSWSSDSLFLISGSVDNSAIIWDIKKGQKDAILKDHKGFVQGVAWDPQNKYLATLSSDRICRIFSVKTKKTIHRVFKSWLPLPGLKPELEEEKTFRLYHDDTFKSFFRRLSFSPCGELLLTPSGHIEVDEEGTEGKKRDSNATYIFTRHMLNKPAIYLPTGDNYTIAVRCCPILFELRTDCPLQEDATNSLIPLPYRCVFAVATQDSVLLYDTQQEVPVGCVSNIHYTRLSDISWSSDGLLLMVSSTDGYCSIVTFSPGELGTPYKTTKPEEGPVEPMEEMSDEEEIKLFLEDTLMEPKLKDEVLAKPLKQDAEAEEVLATPLEDDTDKPEEVLAKPLDEDMEVAKPHNEPKSPNKAASSGAKSAEQKYLSPKKAEQANMFLTPVKTNPVTSPSSGERTPGNEQKKTPKRATLITLSSPKSKKNLYKN